MKYKYLTGLALVVIFPFLYGFTSNNLTDKIANDKRVTVTGEQLFQKNCAVCHGIDRQGKPPVFPSLVTVNERMSKKQVLELLQTMEGLYDPGNNGRGMGCRMRCGNR